MHAQAHEVNGPSFAHAILTAKELLALLPSSFSCVIQNRGRFVLASWRFNMARNTDDKQAKDEETISEQEIWWTIRYLDPDLKNKASDRWVIITLLALLTIVCVVVAVLNSRGL
jgi:hypothetical protein